MFANFIQELFNSFTDAVLNLVQSSMEFLPKLLTAIAFFAIGWVLASLIEKLIEAVFKSLKIDAALKSAGLEDIIKRSGYNLNSGFFVGTLVKWFVIVVFLIASFDALKLNAVTSFLQEVVGFLPSVIVAVLILMVAVIVANAMQKIVVASSRAAHIRSADVLGNITKWAIWIFALVAVIDKLAIVQGLLQIVLMPLTFGIALALGLAFGLGGKDAAQKAIENTMKNMADKE